MPFSHDANQGPKNSLLTLRCIIELLLMQQTVAAITTWIWVEYLNFFIDIMFLFTKQQLLTLKKGKVYTWNPYLLYRVSTQGSPKCRNNIHSPTVGTPLPRYHFSKACRLGETRKWRGVKPMCGNGERSMAGEGKQKQWNKNATEKIQMSFICCFNLLVIMIHFICFGNPRVVIKVKTPLYTWAKRHCILVTSN